MLERSNPYTLAIAQRAVDEVSTENNIDSIMLQPTDFYVRWMPHDSTQLSVMKTLNDVAFFDYPLDVMLTDEELAAYRDTVKGVFYSVVPVDKVLPDCEDLYYEILDEVYIQRNNFNRKQEQLSQDLYYHVFRKSLELTGNVCRERNTVSTWTPSARIYYKEDEPALKQRNVVTPFKGVKVCVNDYYNIAMGCTNDRGETGPLGSFTNPVRYSIHWQDEKWIISEFITGEGYTFLRSMGPEQKEEWSYTIAADAPHSSKDMVVSGAHRALYAYYYENYAPVAALTKHAEEEPLDVVFRFWASDAAGMYYNNTIDLYPVWDADSYYPKYYVTMHTFHELGHGMQDAVNGSDILVDRDVSESWATFIEYLYMDTVYPGFADRKYFPTGICVSETSAAYSFVGPSLLHNGFTPVQIENSVRMVTTWEEWKQSVKSLGVLENKRVDQIFEYPNTFLNDINNLIKDQLKLS